MDTERARSGKRSRCPTASSTSACSRASSSCPTAWRKSGSSSSGGSSPLGAAAGFAWAMRWSLFRLYKEGKTLSADDADGLAGLGARLAPRPPELALDANLPGGPAGGLHHGARSDQRFRAGLDAPPSREADPEIGLRHLDDGACSYEHEPPRRRHDEERQEDGSDEEQRLLKRPERAGIPERTFFKAAMPGGETRTHTPCGPRILSPSRQAAPTCASRRLPAMKAFQDCSGLLRKTRLGGKPVRARYAQSGRAWPSGFRPIAVEESRSGCQ